MIPGYELMEGKFLTRDQCKLHYRFFRNPKARDTIFLLHGHGEHSGRYVKFASQLRDQNLSIAMYDMRGSGLSEGEACFVNRFEDYLNDFSDFCEFLGHEDTVEGKSFILGHSNGGLVAVLWALENPERIKALFLSSPYLGLTLPRPLVVMNNFLAGVLPHFVYRNPVYPPFLTHNPEELVNYKKDGLIRRKITSRLLSEMMKAHAKLASIKSFEFSFPVMILMSGLDRVVNPAATREFYDKLRVPSKDLRVFEGLYHEIYNELGQDEVFEALRQQIAIARLSFPV